MPYDPLGFYVSMIYPFHDPSRNQSWKCITTLPPKKEGSDKDGALPNGAQSYDDVIKLVNKRRGWFGAGVFATLATFKFVDTNNRTKDGWPYVVRNKQNVSTLNSFWLDVDVDPGKPNAYKTRDDALAGWSKFLNAGHMPAPSMIVNSGGGGFHVYWCTHDPMDLATWTPLAEALKSMTASVGLIVDGKCTADAARILRVPTTYNWKSGNRIDVELVQPTAVLQYTMKGLSDPLRRYIAVGSVQAQATGTGAPVVTSQWTQNFAGGLKDDDRTLPPLTIDQIAVACPATAQTLLDGGVGKSEPDWNNDVYLAAWTSDPVAAAHRLSSGYNGYDVTKTDKKLAEKQAAIAGSATMGWPKCVSFNHAACKTCSYLQYGKSPIYFAHQLARQRDAQIPNKGYAVDDIMPAGYWRNDQDFVFAESDTGPVNVLGYPVHDAGFDDSASKSEIVVKTSIAHRKTWRNVNVLKSTAAGVCEAWLKAGVAIIGDQKVVRTFTMNWLKHLQNAKRERKPVSYGWHDDSFVFGDDMFTPAGIEPAYLGNKGDDRFKRVGDLKPWQDAMQQLIYGKPALEIIVATAFAAPLMELAYDFSATLSTYSEESGIGKSTAMKCGQSVWGATRGGMSMLNDTTNATMQKAVTLKNLPLYWDEVKGDEQVTKLADLVMWLAQGQNKSRMNAKAENQPVATTTTLMVAASNESIFEEVLRKIRNTQAAGYRVFEYEVPRYSTSLSTGQAEAMLVRLKGNYGCAGAAYAEGLVKNKAMVHELIAAVQEDLRPCAFAQNERFWEAIIVTLLAGAHIANRFELTHFDMSAMKEFLLRALVSARSGLITESHTILAAGAEDNLVASLLGSTRNSNVVVTDTIYASPAAGRQAPQVAKNDISHARDIWLQYGEQDGRILMRSTAFNDWVEANKLKSPRQVIKLLERRFTITKVKRTIGAGVIGVDIGVQAWCWFLDPKVSHTPSSPSANSGSPVPTTPAS